MPKVLGVYIILSNTIYAKKIVLGENVGRAPCALYSRGPTCYTLIYFFLFTGKAKDKKVNE